MLASVCNTNFRLKSGQTSSTYAVESSFECIKFPLFAIDLAPLHFYPGQSDEKSGRGDEVWNESSVPQDHSEETLHLAKDSATALIFLGSVRMPSMSTMCSRYLIRLTQNLHLSGLRRNFATLKRRNTLRSISKCSSNERLITVISSKYTRTYDSRFNLKTV